MNKIDKRFLVIAFLFIAALFLFFGSGEMMNGGMNGKMNDNGLLSANHWWWFSTIILLVCGVALSWLLYGKKIN